MKTPTHKTPKTRLKRLNKPLFNKTNKTLDLFNQHGRLKRVNDKNQNDRLEILKANCEQEIRDTEEKLRLLRAKRGNLIMLAQESEKLANPKSEPDRYANKGLTETILEVVERLKNVSVHGANTSQIRDYMIAHGFPLYDNSHNFSVAVATTLQRLVAQRRVRRIREAGNNFYKPV
jgi:hypothetical protein